MDAFSITAVNSLSLSSAKLKRLEFNSNVDFRDYKFFATKKVDIKGTIEVKRVT